ncbi:MAG: pyridoxal-phosphate dependent enzyme, partial [Phycisphaerales bacterium]|nr:pyridoxal-phosphate dependent enzyme [Phycisphaerales bacterium]
MNDASRPDAQAPPTPVIFEDVLAAAHAIAPHAHRTPVMTSRTLNALTGATVLCKCECFQRVGAFKFRGACNALSRYDRSGGGVITYSSGNHAQAIALAASIHRIPAVIVMPTNAPAVKLAATRGYLAGAPAGSEVVLYDPATEVREEVGAQIAAARGLTIVPPYDHPHVIAGQGTVALELFESHGPLDALYVCT